jgi:hypothetical protein
MASKGESNTKLSGNKWPVKCNVILHFSAMRGSVSLNPSSEVFLVVLADYLFSCDSNCLFREIFSFGTIFLMATDFL